VRTAGNHKDGMNYKAILDLKAAYESVPLQLIMRRVREKLPQHLADMVALCLQPSVIKTKGDRSGTTAAVTRGVPQEGTASPVM